MIAFVFLTFVYALQISYAAVTIPVFMMDPEQAMVHVQIEPNPFAKMSSENFADIIHDSDKRSAGIIFFVEETFSAEVISTKDVYGTPYKNLQAALLANKDKVKYFPSVMEPYKQIKHKFPMHKKNVFYLSQRSRLQLQDNFKYIYIFFQDGLNETKADVLKRHDAIIKEVLGAIRQLKRGPVIAYYTGKKNPIVVKKVEFVNNKPTVSSRRAGIAVASARARFRLFGVHSATQTRRSVYDRPPKISVETFTQRQLITRVSFTEFELQWTFDMQAHGWKLEHITVYEGDEEVGRTVMNVGAPYNYSYYCPEPIEILNTRDGSTITIDQILVEPKLDGSSTGFGPSVHCTPFFTSSILACLMVTFLCLSILLYGFVTLMDCATNDRFEDPNSKPLSHEVTH